MLPAGLDSTYKQQELYYASEEYKESVRNEVESKKRRDRAAAITEGGDEMADAITRRQGDYDPNPEEFASGGIARMLGE